MKLVVRICLYAVLLVVAAIFFGRFRSAYVDGTARDRSAESGIVVPAEPITEPPTLIDTNRAAVATNAAVTTNATLVTPPVPSVPTGTNAVWAGQRGIAVVTKPPVPPKKADAFMYLGVFLLAMLGLGGLGAWDVARYFGERAGRSIMADDWIERKDPEYEKAEEEWAKGNHLDAIGLMRDYLKKNPNEQHVALRIAEIYEKDMGNFLAAALELEEVLAKKLPREKWGWTAIRLSNLYSGRLNQPDKAMAILQRIVKEYADTGAAKKARQRLGFPEPEDAAAESAPESGGVPPEEGSGSPLPKGFRPKK